MGVTWLTGREIGEVHSVLLAWYQECAGDHRGWISLRHDHVDLLEISHIL
jgi:hypothetical protein